MLKNDETYFVHTARYLKYVWPFLNIITERVKLKMLTPAGIYLLKVNNRATRTRSEICSKLTIKIPERR